MSFLKKISLNWERVENRNNYPFNIPAISNLDSLSLDHNVIFIVGENGTGKSTLLEAVAYQCGFGIGRGKESKVKYMSKRLKALIYKPFSYTHLKSAC